MEKFLTVEQVAASLQVNLDTVRHWLRTKQLHGVKVGRAWRVPEAELHRLSHREGEREAGCEGEREVGPN